MVPEESRGSTATETAGEKWPSSPPVDPEAGRSVGVRSAQRAIAEKDGHLNWAKVVARAVALACIAESRAWYGSALMRARYVLGRGNGLSTLCVHSKARVPQPPHLAKRKVRREGGASLAPATRARYPAEWAAVAARCPVKDAPRKGGPRGRPSARALCAPLQRSGSNASSANAPLQNPTSPELAGA